MRLKEVSTDPINILKRYNKKDFPRGFTKNIHQQLCVQVICGLDFDHLDEAYALIPKSMHLKVLKAFWNKHKQDGSAWKIDQNELPEPLRKRRLQGFGDYVMRLVETKKASDLEHLIQNVPEMFEGSQISIFGDRSQIFII